MYCVCVCMYVCVCVCVYVYVCLQQGYGSANPLICQFWWTNWDIAKKDERCVLYPENLGSDLSSVAY